MYLNRKGVINFWLHGTYQFHKNDQIVSLFVILGHCEVPTKDWVGGEMYEVTTPSYLSLNIQHDPKTELLTYY